MDKKKHNEAFGRVLRVLRKQQGYTQETLGFAANLDRTYISLLELGTRSPTLDTLYALCCALDVSLTVFASLIEADLAGKRR